MDLLYSLEKATWCNSWWFPVPLGQMSSWNPGLFNSPRQTSSAYFDMTENQVRNIWEELGIGDTGYLNKHELAIVCENIGLKELEKEVSCVAWK